MRILHYLCKKNYEDHISNRKSLKPVFYRFRKSTVWMDFLFVLQNLRFNYIDVDALCDVLKVSKMQNFKQMLKQ